MVKKEKLHKTPKDLKNIFASNSGWKNITPLARNEWICWVESAKKQETRNHRIKRMFMELKEGKKRPCCWAGCIHR